MKRRLISVFVVILTLAAREFCLATSTNNCINEQIATCLTQSQQTRSALQDWITGCFSKDKDGQTLVNTEESDIAGYLIDRNDTCLDACSRVFSTVQLVNLVTEPDRKEEALIILRTVLLSEQGKLHQELFMLQAKHKDVPAAAHFTKVVKETVDATLLMVGNVATQYNLELKEDK